MGKTTTAVNLARCAHLRGIRTLLVDLDSQANTTKVVLGAAPGPEVEALADVLSQRSDATAKDVILGTSWSGVDVITAEQVKIQTSTADAPTVTVQGRDASSGRPRVASIGLDEVVEVVRPVVASIIQTLAACLDDLPPQAVGDILADGVTLFGGGSLTRNFASSLELAFGFPVKLADRPLTCVAAGAALAVHNPDLLNSYGRA